MIFVTVGTHEQPFDRLVKCIDNIKKEGLIKEEVIIQTGFCTYEPKYCEWEKFYTYQKMLELIETARIVITHGGPSSFIAPIQMGKIPIVVPRRLEFGEHVNNHQVKFCDEVAKRLGTIMVVNEIDKLSVVLEKYDEDIANIVDTHMSNNSLFCQEFEKIVTEILER